MKLLHYLDQLPKGGKSQFAKEIDVSKSFLSQMASGNSKVPIRVAKIIEEHTLGKVTKAELRPDVWGNNKSKY